MDVRTTKAKGPVGGVRAVPASKSLHQRALVLAALGGSSTHVEAPAGLAGEDVQRLEAALLTLGAWDESGAALGTSRDRLSVDLGLGATGFRFVVAAATLRPRGARTLVTGRPPLLARPHRPLRMALTRLGARVKRRPSGAIRVRGGGIRGGRLPLRADVSSQFASALLLIAPRIGGLEIELLDRPVSRPYLDLTLDVLRAFGIDATAEGLDEPHGVLRVPAGAPAAATYRVEADASCAAPWWAAAALTGGALVVEDLPADTKQADAALLEVLERMGARVRTEGDRVEVAGRPPLRAPGTIDLRDAPDLLPLVGALACAATGTTVIAGAGHARFKESDRLATTAAAVHALGGRAEADGGTLTVDGGHVGPGVVDVAGDHRLAFAFGVLGLVVDGVVLRGAEAAAKSYPTFLAELGEAATGGGAARPRPP